MFSSINGDISLIYFYFYPDDDTREEDNNLQNRKTENNTAKESSSEKSDSFVSVTDVYGLNNSQHPCDINNEQLNKGLTDHSTTLLCDSSTLDHLNLDDADFSPAIMSEARQNNVSHSRTRDDLPILHNSCDSSTPYNYQTSAVLIEPNIPNNHEGRDGVNASSPQRYAQPTHDTNVGLNHVESSTHSSESSYNTPLDAPPDIIPITSVVSNVISNQTDTSDTKDISSSTVEPQDEIEKAENNDKTYIENKPDLTSSSSRTVSEADSCSIVDNVDSVHSIQQIHSNDTNNINSTQNNDSTDLRTMKSTQDSDTIDMENVELTQNDDTPEVKCSDLIQNGDINEVECVNSKPSPNITLSNVLPIQNSSSVEVTHINSTQYNQHIDMSCVDSTQYNQPVDIGVDDSKQNNLPVDIGVDDSKQNDLPVDMSHADSKQPCNVINCDTVDNSCIQQVNQLESQQKNQQVQNPFDGVQQTENIVPVGFPDESEEQIDSSCFSSRAIDGESIRDSLLLKRSDLGGYSKDEAIFFSEFSNNMDTHLKNTNEVYTNTAGMHNDLDGMEISEGQLLLFLKIYHNSP